MVEKTEFEPDTPLTAAFKTPDGVPAPPPPTVTVIALPALTAKLLAVL
jgi:hypothetical protein